MRPPIVERLMAMDAATIAQIEQLAVDLQRRAAKGHRLSGARAVLTAVGKTSRPSPSDVTIREHASPTGLSLTIGPRHEEVNPMKTDQSPLIVTTGVCRECQAVHTIQVHHRDYPEIQAEGESPELAAAQLVNRLSRVLDTAPDRWRNESIQSAIADIQALIARDA